MKWQILKNQLLLKEPKNVYQAIQHPPQVQHYLALRDTSILHAKKHKPYWKQMQMERLKRKSSRNGKSSRSQTARKAKNVGTWADNDQAIKHER